MLLQGGLSTGDPQTPTLTQRRYGRMGACSRGQQWQTLCDLDCLSAGGVAERLIAPVLKTGRPKGLVSSNLTPSAFFSLSVLEGPNGSQSRCYSCPS